MASRVSGRKVFGRSWIILRVADPDPIAGLTPPIRLKLG